MNGTGIGAVKGEQMKPEDMLGGAPVGRPYIRTRDVYQTDNDRGVEGYSDEALALVADTAKTGVPEGVNAVGMAGSAKHGTIAVQIFARVNPETHVIEQAGYRAHGCLAMIASACAAVYWMEGKAIEEVAAVSADFLAEARGVVPRDKSYTARYAACAVRGVCGDFHIRQGATFEDMRARSYACDETSLDCVMCENCSLRNSMVDLEIASRLRAAEEA